MNNKERLSLIMILTMLLADCDSENRASQSSPPPSSSQSSPQINPPKILSSAPEIPAPKVLQEDKSYVFLERETDATDGGVARLIDKMTVESFRKKLNRIKLFDPVGSNPLFSDFRSYTVAKKDFPESLPKSLFSAL